MNRRTFLKIAGMSSVSLAAGCSDPQRHLFTLVHAPDDMVTGQPNLYATTCRECPAGCGVLAKNREGRVIKLEGNPEHPVNRGALCMRGQAALQGLYNPDRLKVPMLREGTRWRPISFEEAEALVRDKAARAAAKGPARVQMLTETVGDSLLSLFSDAMTRWKSGKPVVFEPFAYESLRTANEAVFGFEGLFSYRIEDSDLLISFGADFLETWLSPVEHARQFKTMHALTGGGKGMFFFVGPCQTLTCANADMWIGCHPGGEAAVAFGIIRELLSAGRGQHLRTFLRSALLKTAEQYTPGKVVQISGVDPDRYRILVHQLLQAERPLVLGSATGYAGQNSLQTNVLANLINVILDPSLARIDFDRRYRVETAARRSEVIDFFRRLQDDRVEVALLHQANPVFHLSPGAEAEKALSRKSLFTVLFSTVLDETAQMADLVFPLRHSLESWDDYEGKAGFVSLLQPASGRLTGAPTAGDLFLRLGSGGPGNYREHLLQKRLNSGQLRNEKAWLEALARGGFDTDVIRRERSESPPYNVMDPFHTLADPIGQEMVFIAAPSIRFFDGRGADRPWLAEIPDPVTMVAWQSPLIVHPETLKAAGLEQGDIATLQSRQGSLEAPVVASETVRPNVLLMGIGQGHAAMGRYAQNVGKNPLVILPVEPDPRFGGPQFSIFPVSIHDSGRKTAVAHTDGSRVQHGRKIALTVSLEELHSPEPEKPGLTMETFPLTLPLPEGYDPKRDFYPPHDHDGYRWSMVVDLDRCIGCGACEAACYAENNIGIVGQEQVIRGREMAWLRVERYVDAHEPGRLVFLPMMCQHCDNAPCESVCPVYAPHHSKEGLNNQIYNRCIGTRFCAQNCPYKVRRFNWYTWPWPDPLPLQLNPDVTVRSKGVMEKCSFCVQRIKAARNRAKNENRRIRDGEVVPACAQTCPTGALSFGNLMEKNSRVRGLVDDPRAYQVMGYLNTKPAVIYLKKVRTDARFPAREARKARGSGETIKG